MNDAIERLSCGAPQAAQSGHHPTIQRRSGQSNSGRPQQNRALPKEREVIGIFADHRINHDPITGQAFSQ
jgi:hypothetical protein